MLRTSILGGLWGNLARKEPLEEGFKISRGEIGGPLGRTEGERFLLRGCSGSVCLTQSALRHPERREQGLDWLVHFQSILGGCRLGFPVRYPKAASSYQPGEQLGGRPGF